MHIVSCLEPRKVFNPYLKQVQIVPCGRCSACLTARSAKMVERLECESQCNNFRWFFTLTYAPEYLPLLIDAGTLLIDKSARQVHWKIGALTVDWREELSRISDDVTAVQSCKDFIKLTTAQFGGVPHLSSVDIQKFMKRLRSIIYREFKKALQNETTSEKLLPQLRYFIGCEYGENTFRPHYHGILFFNSYWLSAHITEFIRQAWSFGNIDSSPVEYDASSYVAGYLNGYGNLPLLYQLPSLRPFSLYSKHPAIGSLVYNSEEIKSMFLTKSFSQIVWRQRQHLFQNVPLWRTIQDKLYPRLSFFDFIPYDGLCVLYSYYATKCRRQPDNFAYFRWSVESCNNVTVKDYLVLLKSYKGDYESKLQRWYIISRRVLYQSNSFGLSVNEYVRNIYDYYNDMKLHRLGEWYKFCEDYAKEHNPLDLAAVDPLFVSRIVSKLTGISHSIDREFLHDYTVHNVQELDLTERLYLSSFGVDLDKLLNSDLKVRNEMIARLFYYNTDDYKLFKENSNITLLNSTKTKKKNDYQYSKNDWYMQLLSGGYVDDYDDTNFYVDSSDFHKNINPIF